MVHDPTAVSERTGFGKSRAVICCPRAVSIPKRVTIRSRFCRRKSANASFRLSFNAGVVSAAGLAGSLAISPAADGGGNISGERLKKKRNQNARVRSRTDLTRAAYTRWHTAYFIGGRISLVTAKYTGFFPSMY